MEQMFDWRIQVTSAGPNESLAAEVLLKELGTDKVRVQFIQVSIEQGEPMIDIADQSGMPIWRLPYAKVFHALCDINGELGLNAYLRSKT